MGSDGLVPALVVVDTWNLRGQSHDLLGERRFPTVDGIRRGWRRTVSRSCTSTPRPPSTVRVD